MQQDRNGCDALAVRVAALQGFPPTAAIGEHLAVALVATTLAGQEAPPAGIECVSDCAGVVRSAEHRSWAVGEARPYAGIWAEIPSAIRVRKTKAHRTAMQARHDGQLMGWSGNAFADSQARLAAQSAAPADQEAALFVTQVELQANVLRAIAKQLACWPQVGAAVQAGLWHRRAAQGNAVQARLRPQKRATPHSWGWVAGLRKWACHTCGLLTRSGLRRARHGCVVGLAGEDLARILADTRSSHKPMVFDTGPGELPLVFCNQCGAFSQTCLRQLQAPCFGLSPSSRAAEQRLRRLRRGQHPMVDDVFASAIRPAWVFHPPLLLPADVAALSAAHWLAGRGR